MQQTSLKISSGEPVSAAAEAFETDDAVNTDAVNECDNAWEYPDVELSDKERCIVDGNAEEACIEVFWCE